ncbi:hypothetical protein BDR03DRAFT_944134 [Suillus americanus]|nr:hypothetical protein BDR03DRAFT_944134 [Suillus americanus]
MFIWKVAYQATLTFLDQQRGNFYGCLLVPCLRGDLMTAVELLEQGRVVFWTHCYWHAFTRPLMNFLRQVTLVKSRRKSSSNTFSSFVMR